MPFCYQIRLECIFIYNINSDGILNIEQGANCKKFHVSLQVHENIKVDTRNNHNLVSNLQVEHIAKK